MSVKLPLNQASVMQARSRQLFDEHRSSIAARIDRMFVGLLLLQWLACVVTAVFISPLTWSGTASATHLHVWTALLLGGTIVSLPIALAVRRPGAQLTRHAIAVSQALLSALFIHFSGGRIETHFHVFGSLALLAFYRDGKVLISASAVVAVDHLVRGMFWPQSVFGDALVHPWRWLEHGAWVAVEDVFLIMSCRQGLREMRSIAERQAILELSNEHIKAEIAARVQAESDLRAAIQAAELANQSKSEFLANMSHEIRTPMTAIVGHSELLMSPDQDASDRLNSVQAIQRNGEHLLQLINDILDLSKIEAGKMTTERTTCSPCTVLADVASMMRVRAISKSLYFHIEYEGLIPQTIESDPTRLRQILLNLIGNSLKFTARGGVRVICRLLDPPDAQRPRMSIAVSDTGIGLTAEQSQRLFQPFAQADSSTTRRFGGTGLGLTISKRLAQALGGDIVVNSKSGEGSTFTLTIETGNLKDAVMLDSPREADFNHQLGPQSGGEVDRISLAGRRILLAEDGPDNQFLISMHLSKKGATVEIAENGVIAVELALAAASRGQPFDLIFMDMQMPEMDGYAATSKLRFRGYRGPIVALTAHAMTGDREKCLVAGCDDYTTKPINKGQLLTIAARYACQKHEKPTPVATAVPGDVLPPLASSYADDPDMTEVIERFVAHLGDKMQELSAAIEAQDFPRLEVLTHQLKGSGGGFGFEPISRLAAALERTINNDAPLPAVRGMFDELRLTCARAVSTQPTH